MLSGANGVFFSCIAAWITNIFSLRENFSLFEVFPRYLLSFYCRCIDIYHHFSLPFSFYFFVKTTLILYLTSNFFSCVKITLFSSSCFLIKSIFITLQRYYFCTLYFSFSSWKVLSVPCCVLLIYGTAAFPAVLFSVCMKFSRNRLRSSVLSFIF